MRRRRARDLFFTCLAGFAISSLTAGGAHAEIRIVKANGQPVPSGAASKIFNPKTGGWDVTLAQLYAPGADSVFEIHGDAGEIIDNVYSAVDGPPAGSPVIVRLLGDAPGFLRTVRNFIQIGTAETILNKVNVTEDIGSIQVEAIGDLIAGRDILGPITATTTDNSIRGITKAHAGRHISGNLLAEHGRILLVYAPNGDIGTSGKPVSIRAKFAVYQVEARNVYADINTRVNSGTGGFFALICERFIGAISTEKLILNQYSGVDGLIYITQQFSGTISLGKSYTSPTQYMQFPVNGLAGQVIINADNVTGGSWTAPVRVGPNGNPNQIVLANPSYAQLPSTLGGGSVGLVPFRLHHQACYPANGAIVSLPPNSAPITVQLRHYGPVSRSVSVPLTIERRPAGTNQSFIPLLTSDFVADIPAASSTVITLGPAPGKPGFAAGYDYRIRPTPQLRCDVPAAPPVVWDGDYNMTVLVPSCVGDVNGDGVVNVNDLLIIIASWGPASPSFPAPDLNSDGFVNVNDLLAVISHWGACW